MRFRDALAQPGLGAIAAYELGRNRRTRGFSYLGGAFALMAATCGPHHLVHAEHHLIWGQTAGIPMTAKAGSIVVFSSVVIHRSGPNLTDRNRRVYIAQYSQEVIPAKDGTTAHGSFDPFLAGGRNIADR